MRSRRVRFDERIYLRQNHVTKDHACESLGEMALLCSSLSKADRLSLPVVRIFLLTLETLKTEVKETY